MSDSRFPILGADIPPMLGRTKIMQRLRSNLTKQTPSHMSVVGPRYSGKSVLLKALEQQMSADGLPYCAVILWDLGHQTPRSDEDFMKLLCQRLGDGIYAADKDYGEHLLAVESDEYVEICEVMDALNEDGKKLLMLWDGFDKPLSGGTLSRNLWDNLLDLCRKPSFRLVTSTRKELHQLIRDEKSVTSDFWGVFEGIVRVTAFDEADVDTILSGLTDLVFQPGAKTELMNWSAGIPPLLLEVLNQIIVRTLGGQVDNQMVNQAAFKASETMSGLLSSVWDDCPARAKDLYTYLMDRGDLLLTDVGKDERVCLIDKGLARQSSNKLSAACRMLKEHIQGAGPDAGSMVRLFGTWDDYKVNIRNLLERRMAHISQSDERLHRLVAQAIEAIPEYPDDCLNNLTHIEERALDLIWLREFGQTKIIPKEIIDYWEEAIPNDTIVQQCKAHAWDPESCDRLLQCRILQLLTGSKGSPTDSKVKYASKAKYTSKDTYVLINAIHSFRNRNQHPDGKSMHVGVAVAAVMACMELLSCLDRELVT